MNVNIEQARTIISAAFSHGHDAGFNALAVCVLDSGGHVVAFEKEDGTANGRFAIAHGKAHGAISFGTNSGFIEKIGSSRPSFVSGLVSVAGPMVPAAGGVIILDGDGAPMGAVGISGDSSENDEAAAFAGIDAAGLSYRP